MKKNYPTSAVTARLSRWQKTIKALTTRQVVLPRVLALMVLLAVGGLASSAQAALKTSAGSGTWNVGATWVGGVAPASIDTVLILAGHSVTNGSATSIGSITVDSGGILTVNSTLTCDNTNTPSWLVNGAINNTGGNNTVALRGNATMVVSNGGFYTNASSGSGIVSFGSGASITFAPGSTYVNNKNGGSVPTSTFQAGSKAVFIGNISSAPAVQTAGQAFGTVIWNCAQTAAIGTAGMFDTTILGDFIIQNTGGFEMRLASTQTGSMNLAGNLIVTNGILNLSSSTGVQTMNVSNNVVVTSGGTVTVTTAGRGILALQKTGGIPFTMTGTLGSGVKTVIPITSSLTVSNTETLGIMDVSGLLNLNGQALTANALTNSVPNTGLITNGNASITLVIGVGNSSGVFGGTIAQGIGTISLTKNGTGTQALNGANTYTGSTTINAGTLALGQSTLAPNSTVTIASNAVLQLNFATTNTVAGLVTNGIAAGPGVYNANNSSPYLNGAGSLIIFNSMTNGSSAADGSFTVNSLNGKILTLHFNTLLSATGSATNIDNYTAYGKATGSLTITNAVLLGDTQSVVLYLNSTAGEFFAVGVSNVLDANGSNIVNHATGYQTSFTGVNIGTAGDPSLPGEVFKFSIDAYQIEANGSDIGGTNDHCHFVSDAITGDFELVANLTRLDFTDADAKVCLMARETAAPGSRFVAIGFTPLVPGFGTNRVVMLARMNPDNDAVDFGNPPHLDSLSWLRMTRTNNLFAVYHGTNGLDWTLCGSVTNALTNTASVGVAVTAHANNLTTTANLNDFGIAGTRFGTGIIPTLGITIVSNSVVAKWQRTPRDFTVQVTDNLITSAGVSNPPPIWSYMLLPVFDTSLTGTNAFMPTVGRYMTIPMSFFSNSTMFVRLAQVERVIPDPLGVTPGLVLSVGDGNMVSNAAAATLLGGHTVNTTNSVIIPITNYLTLSPYTNYTFTTENSTNLRTVMVIRRATNIFGVNTSIGVATNAGIGNAGLAKITLSAIATNYTVIIAATNKYTPTASNPLRLRIDFQ